MHSSQLIQLVVGFTKHGKHDLDRRAVHLREARLLSKSGRGLYAQEMSPQDATNLIIALMAAHRAPQAVNAVIEYSKLKPTIEPFFGATTFGEALDEIFNNPNLAEYIDKIYVCRTFPETMIVYKFGNDILEAIFQPGEGFTDESGYDVRPFMRVDASIDGFVLHQIAISLANPPGTDTILKPDEIMKLKRTQQFK